jgi:hypothetical protein
MRVDATRTASFIFTSVIKGSHHHSEHRSLLLRGQGPLLPTLAPASSMQMLWEFVCSMSVKRQGFKFTKFKHCLLPKSSFDVKLIDLWSQIVTIGRFLKCNYFLTLETQKWCFQYSVVFPTLQQIFNSKSINFSNYKKARYRSGCKEVLSTLIKVKSRSSDSDSKVTVTVLYNLSRWLFITLGISMMIYLLHY